MRRYLPFLLALFAAALGLRLWLFGGAGSSPTAAKGAYVGAPAPGFRLTDLAGRVVSLDDYRGKPVLINFWASWCPGCVEELPDLQRLYDKHKKQGFSVVAVSLDDTRAQVMSFVAKMDPTFTIVMCDPKTQRAYEVYGLPTSFLVDQKGVVVKKYPGGLDPAEAEKDILDVLNRRPS